MSDLTATELRRVLDYDPETGIFRWRICPNGRVKVGAVAGKTMRIGYRSIRIRGRGYSAHRLAWLHVHGEWPSAQIDHRNRSRDDNRISNLREATSGQNNANRPARPSKSGLTGVFYRAQIGQWEAYHHINGRHVYLGCFDSAEEASAARLVQVRLQYGEFVAA